MEQHAVPQDITGFKFKLVGDMTLKQFGELAGGAVIAYLFFASGWHPILKWPGVFIFGLLGFALAFLPVEERPLDIWIINFIKAIYQPTLYIWKKSAVVAQVTTASPAIGEPQVTVTPWPYAPPPPPPAPEPQPAPPPPMAPASPLSIEDLQKLRDEKIQELQGVTKKLEKNTTELKEDTYRAQRGPAIITVDDLAKRRDEKYQEDQNQLYALLEENKNLITQIESVKTRIQALAGLDTSQLQAQLTNLSTQHDSLAGRINSLQDQLTGKKPEDKGRQATSEDDQVKVVDKPVARQTTISLTDVPNVINGAVTSNRGVPLENTILVVKDKAGNSIRAMKTNQIGQFIASTPLENETYYLEFERPGYSFDVLEITLDGKVITPIDVHARPV